MYMTDLGNWLNSFLTGYITNVVSQLCGYLWPLALLMLTLYIANYGLAVVRGEVAEPMEVFAWKVAKLTMIGSFALGSGLYLSRISGVLDGLQDGMATLFVSGGAGGAFTTITTNTGAFGALDLATQEGTKSLVALWAAVDIMNLDILVAAVIYAAGLGIFTLVAGAVTVMAKVFLAFALAIGPAAILCLVFKPTAKFFDSWLSFALSACVLSWFVFFAFGLSLYVVNQVIVDLTNKGAFNPASSGAGMVSPIDGSIAMLIMYALMAILIWQSPKLASALTGGPAMSSGASMVVSYVMGRASAGGGKNDGDKSGGGGDVKGGTGASYSAGRAAGYSYQRVASMFSGRR